MEIARIYIIFTDKSHETGKLEEAERYAKSKILHSN